MRGGSCHDQIVSLLAPQRTVSPIPQAVWRCVQFSGPPYDTQGAT